MANQPKKYKKFVASAATATLVASAIVPVASAATPSDIAGNDHEQNIKDLLELGYVSGKADGSFAPNEAVTRGQVVLMLGKWAEAQGIEVPADYLEKEYFTDYPSYLTDDNKKYYALVKAAGIFEGYADGSLKPGQNISRVQMAVVLNSAYEAVTGKSLVELAGDTSDVVVNDIDAVYADYQPAVLAMKKLGITAVSNYNPSGTVTRGQFASFLNATIKAEAPAGAEASDIKSLTATGVSELTVEFNGVVDPEAVEFKLTRGTTEYAVSDVDFNENNTAAVLTVDTKFVDATYTLTATGVAEEAVTASVTTTREVATSINFLSDALVFNGVEQSPKDAGYGNNDEASKEAKITFEVLNQYGEDITKTISLSKYEVDVKGIDENHVEVTDEGVVTVWVDDREDDDATGTIELTYEDGDLEIEVSQEVQLSDESEPGEVELVGLYNANDRDLTSANVEKYADDEEGLDLDERQYYILLNVEDQYGVKIDPKVAENYDNSSATEDTTLLKNVRDGLRVNVSNDDIFDLDEDNIIPLNVDGKWYFAIPLEFEFKDNYVKETGDNTVTFLSKATGVENSAVYTLADSSKVNKIELLSPQEVIAGGDTVKLPINAYDQNGELIVDASKLNELYNDDDITIDGDGGKATNFYFVEENEQLFLEFDVLPNADKDDESYELEIELEVTYTDEESSIELEVEPNPYAKTLVGLTKSADKYIYNSTTADTTIELKLEDFVVEDQYGRAFDETGYTIKAEVTSSSSPMVLEGAVQLDDVNDKLIVKLPKENSGNASIKFILEDTIVRDNKDPEASKSEFTQTFRAVDEDDFVSYKVVSDEQVYIDDNVASRTEVEVYGVLGNGTEVQLSTDAYTVVPNSKLTTEDSTFIKAKSVPGDFGKEGDQVVDAGFEVVINDDGTVIANKLQIAEAAPKLVSVSVKDQDSVSGKQLTSFEIDEDSELKASEILELLYDQAIVEFKDQYGNKYNEGKDSFDEVTGTFVDTIDNVNNDDPAVIRVTFSNVNDAADEFTIVNNGSNNAQINGLDKGDSFTLTLKVDDVTKSFIVRVK